MTNRKSKAPTRPRLDTASRAIANVTLIVNFEAAAGYDYWWKIGDTEYPIIDGTVSIPASADATTTLTGQLVGRPERRTS